jgi:hypothetical protein
VGWETRRGKSIARNATVVQRQNHGGAILSSARLPQPYREITVHKLRMRMRVVAATTAAPIIAEVGDSLFKGVTRMTKNTKRMTLEEMEVAIARIDLMIALLRKQLQEGTDVRRVAADLARYQRWRDDLDVQISLERIRRGTYLPRTRHLHS